MSTDDRLDTLTTTARDLQASVDHLARRIRFSRMVVAVLVLLVIGMGVVVYKQNQTEAQVRQSLAQDYITRQEQAQTRYGVLCPMWLLLLSVATDPARLAALPPAQRANAAVAEKVIRDGYTKLGCTTPLP